MMRLRQRRPGRFALPVVASGVLIMVGLCHPGPVAAQAPGKVRAAAPSATPRAAIRPTLRSSDQQRRRKVAILEFRQGVDALPGLTGRLMRLLGKLTSVRLIGPSEARQRLGAELDAVVARCKGEPTCVGSLAARLGVQEVLLVGMSRLGDVIVQFSRVHASSRRLLASLGQTVSPGADLNNAALEGLLRRLFPPADFIRYGHIRVRCRHAKATVYIDGKLQGQVPLPGPIRVRAPASHTVRVEAKGYLPFRATLHVPPDATIQVDAGLPKIPPAVVPTYKRWWFWTAIAVSVAAAAGIAVGVTYAVGNPGKTVQAVIRW